MIEIRSHGRTVAVATALMLVSACGGEAVPDPNAPPTSEQIARGEAVYQDVCSECHSLQPPPNLGPPFTHLGRMLKSELESRADFTRHVVTWVPNPSVDRSLLPDMAVERFGLMPAQVVEEERLTDVAAYLWVMADSAEGGMDHEGGMGEEMGGMGHGPGMGDGRHRGEGMGPGEGMGMGMGMGMRGGPPTGDTVVPPDTIR
jgi:hypothetical protein